MRKTLWTIFIVIVLVVVGAQLFLPAYVAKRLGDGLQAATGISAWDVDVSAFPALRLLAGDVARLAVSADHIVMQGLHVESLQLEAENVRIGVSRLMRGGPLSVHAGGSASLRLTVTAEALTAYARELAELPPDVRIDVGEQGVALAGRVTLLGSPVNATVSGRFEPADHGAVAFVPDRVAVDGQPLPPFMVAILRELYSVRLNLTEGPLPMTVDEVIHMPGKLIVIGRPLLDGFDLVLGGPHQG